MKRTLGKKPATAGFLRGSSWLLAGLQLLYISLTDHIRCSVKIKIDLVTTLLILCICIRVISPHCGVVKNLYPIYHMIIVSYGE